MSASRSLSSLLRDLVRPLDVGRRIARDVRLEHMAISASGAALEYTLSTGTVLVVAERAEGTRSPWVTDRYAVSLQERQRRLAPDEADALRVLLALISRNEHLADAEARAPSRRPTLYLVPGHLGRPSDLTLRALAVLRATPHVFVEVGQAGSAHELLAQHGALTPETSIHEYEEEPGAAARVVALLEAGSDVALFGSTEGTPCFMDPGRSIVDAVSALGPRAAIRTVGGASVLGMALMRVPGNLGHFVFLGHLDSDAAIRIAEPTLGRIEPRDTAIVFYAPSAGLRAALRRVAERLRGHPLHLTLLVDLTTDAERVIEMPLDSLLDDQIELDVDTCWGGAVAIVRVLVPTLREPGWEA